MKGKAISDAITNISTQYIEKAADYTVTKKAHKSGWMKWCAMAACLCLVAISVFALLPKQTEPNIPEKLTAPHFMIDENTFMISSYLSISEDIPDGFSYAGDADIDGVGDRVPFYTNPSVPEWVYVYQEVRTTGEMDETGTLIPAEPHNAYVRYVDIRLRGKDLLSCNNELYISMRSVSIYEPADVSQEYYDTVKTKYGIRIEGAAPDGFVLAGTASSSGHDTIPNGALSVNTEEAMVYLSEAEPNIAFVETHWYTAPKESGDEEVRQDGFNVYIRYDCPLELSFV